MPSPINSNVSAASVTLSAREAEPPSIASCPGVAFGSCAYIAAIIRR